MKVRELSSTEAMSALHEADTNLRKAGGNPTNKDAIANLRAAALAFAVAERNARSAKKRESESDILASLPTATSTGPTVSKGNDKRA